MITDQQQLIEEGYSNFPSLVIPDNPVNAYIQHQGSDCCIDYTCSCGFTEHIDSDFQFYWKCDICSKVYIVGSHLTLTLLNK